MPVRLARTALTLAASLALTLPAASSALATAPAPGHPVDRGAHARAASPDPGTLLGLTKAYGATMKYRSVPRALADGYEEHLCMARDEGGMGFHYFNEALFGSLDPAKPAGLLYEDDGRGGRRLVGVEWVVPVDAAGSTRPRLFGQDFQGPMDGHYPGMPRHYDLHAWLYKQNPKGTFAQWNPRVTCPAATASASTTSTSHT
ncbi:hypothetical protein ACF081_31100 [Streptomyces longwoodensis]|uniref:hypothetical protein n=1 Tax=Streptomyces longwoodensis TaxID=68231 RepID=UPI00370361C1